MMIESADLVRAMRTPEKKPDGDRALAVLAALALAALVVLFVLGLVRAFDADCDAHEDYIQRYRASVTGDVR